MMERICVLGAFGFRNPYYDGQTIKTRNLLSLLQDQHYEVEFFDTQEFKYNGLSVFRMFGKIIRNNVLYYLPAQNNLTYLFPIIYCLSKLFCVKIHYFVVGGWLVEFLSDKPILRKKLSKIAGIHCETKSMKGFLEKEYGFDNVDVFPNFRINDYIPISHHEDGILKLVFMARVIKNKGLDLIFELGNKVIESGLHNHIIIDFYGPQQNEDDDIAYFNSNIVKYDFMEYHGPLEPSEIYSTLDKYDAMLLPTHFYTEGLPGSLLDAYISGIPVIVTKWKHATEFVDDGETGIIIPFDDDGTVLTAAIMKLYNNPDLLVRMKRNALVKWHEFSSEKALELLRHYK